MKLMTFSAGTLLLCLWLVVGCSGPLGPIAGGMLKGSSAEVPVNWDSVAAQEHVQLETINRGKPRSVLIWVGGVDNKLYVATSLISGSSEPGERTWVQNVTDNPNVRLRVKDQIYQLQAVREIDPSRLEAARSTMMSKYDVASDEQSRAAWIYELRAR